MTELDRATIQALLDAGIRLMAPEIEPPGAAPMFIGGDDFELQTPEDAALYVRDPEAATARNCECDSVAEFREWAACQGQPLCGHKTKDGEWCGYTIFGKRDRFDPNGFDYGLEEWRKYHRIGFCLRHRAGTTLDDVFHSKRDRTGGTE
jgi:hypothetical protein